MCAGAAPQRAWDPSERTETRVLKYLNHCAIIAKQSLLKKLLSASATARATPPATRSVGTIDGTIYNGSVAAPRFECPRKLSGPYQAGV